MVFQDVEKSIFVAIFQPNQMWKQKRGMEKKQLVEWAVLNWVFCIHVLLAPYNSHYCSFRCALLCCVVQTDSIQILLIFCFGKATCLAFKVSNVARMSYFVSHIIKWMRDITCLSRYMINLANTTKIRNANVHNIMS